MLDHVSDVNMLLWVYVQTIFPKTIPLGYGYALRARGDFSGEALVTLLPVGSLLYSRGPLLRQRGLEQSAQSSSTRGPLNQSVTRVRLYTYA